MSNVYYSLALRCIGQDLERRGLRTFDIKREGRHFVVVCKHQGVAAVAPEILRYTPADIDFLDRCGEVGRGKKTEKQFLNQVQMLRAIGDHLDKYDSILTRITSLDIEARDSLFRVEYVTREGEHVIDDCPGAAIFDMCVLMFQKRTRLTAAQDRSGR